MRRRRVTEEDLKLFLQFLGEAALIAGVIILAYVLASFVIGDWI